jgi:hypothetical protein
MAHPRLRRVFLSAVEGCSRLSRVYTLNGREKPSPPLRVYTLNGQECFSRLLRVYTLDGWEKRSRPSRVCHQQPGGVLPAAMLGLFLACQPPKPSGFWGIDSFPRRGFCVFYLKFLGIQLPNPLTVLGVCRDCLFGTRYLLIFLKKIDTMYHTRHLPGGTSGTSPLFLT